MSLMDNQNRDWDLNRDLNHVGEQTLQISYLSIVTRRFEIWEKCDLGFEIWLNDLNLFAVWFEIWQWYLNPNCDWDLNCNLNHFSKWIFQIWYLIWVLSLEDSKLLKNVIWDLAKWYKYIYWMIWDLTMRFDLGFAHRFYTCCTSLVLNAMCVVL